MPQQLTADFGAGIGADRPRDIMFFAPRDIRVHAIDGRGRRKDELLDPLLFGEFEQVLGSNDIGALVADRVFDRGADAGLCG